MPELKRMPFDEITQDEILRSVKGETPHPDLETVWKGLHDHIVRTGKSSAVLLQVADVEHDNSLGPAAKIRRTLSSAAEALRQYSLHGRPLSHSGLLLADRLPTMAEEFAGLRGRYVGPPTLKFLERVGYVALPWREGELSAGIVHMFTGTSRSLELGRP